MSRFYRFYHYLAKVLFWIFTRRMIVRGREHIPLHGPAILISNHLSYSDPATIIGYVNRQVYFMTKAEMFNGGFMDWVITKAEAFPVRRGAVDREAIRQALTVLERGDLLGIYPEGTRSSDHHVHEARAGVVLIAKHSAVPLIPVAITGMEHVFRRDFPWIGRPVVTLTIGAPFTLSDITSEPINSANRNQIAERLMGRIAALLPPDYGGNAQPLLSQF
jgi:1-acyl-sn-glycerol-3-phosphate acyltransferase